jgi:hypothetical protein
MTNVGEFGFELGLAIGVVLKPFGDDSSEESSYGLPICWAEKIRSLIGCDDPERDTAFGAFKFDEIAVVKRGTGLITGDALVIGDGDKRVSPGESQTDLGHRYSKTRRDWL